MTQLALSGNDVDGRFYTWVTDQAEHTPHWINSIVSVWTSYGLAVFALMFLVLWWDARRGTSAQMAQVLMAPVTVVVAYLVNSLIKSGVQEQRPCRTIPHSFTVQACPALGDWSFPSNHSVIAFSAMVAVIVVRRTWWWLAGIAAIAMGASRVWIGAHYPHDVAVGAVVGVLVALPLMLNARRAAPLVDKLRSSPLRPAVAATDVQAM